MKSLAIVLILLVLTSGVLAGNSIVNQAPQAQPVSAGMLSQTPTVQAKTPAPKVSPVAAQSTPTAAADVADPQPSLPLRAAFYYAWFPSAWTQKSVTPYTNYTPLLGSYDSADPEVVRKHIAEMQYGHISAGLATWSGQGTETDDNLETLLEAAAGTSFRWAIHYEPQASVTPDQIAQDLTYLHDHYGSDPSYLRIDGRFVVFVSSKASGSCDMADAWKQANTVNAYLVLQVFPDYHTCASQPDGWHQYAPSSPQDAQKGYSYSISAGYWKVGETPRLPRDLSQWYASIRNMVTSRAPFQLVTSFNQWADGTAIEPAKEWDTASGYGAFLDALHNDGQGTPPVMAFAATPPVPTTNSRMPLGSALPVASCGAKRS